MYLDMHRDRGSWGYVIDDTYKAVFGWGKVISSGRSWLPAPELLPGEFLMSWCG